MLDVNNLLSQGNLIYDDCIIIGSSKVIGFSCDASKVVLGCEICIDAADLSDIGYKFSFETNGSVYCGGESSDHGSYGFFLKKTNGSLDWALMALESNPFIRVEICIESVRFLSSAGFTWVVPDDDITKVYIETGELIFLKAL